ncbi:MAG: GTP 3',8-cyclase MoaA [Hydrogenophilus sp.]|nr:GTP 3',8-cyclase MoaA [Hydrogenophilus sp.]
MAESLRSTPLLLSHKRPLPPPISPLPSPLTDALQRPLADLRLSVTDRCNFRCTYCMPRAAFRGHRFLPRAELLTFEEIERIVRLLLPLGIRKIRITGGEPLLRQDLDRLIALLAPLPIELTLTTNGALLAASARILREAGLQRVTVSLDALDPRLFARLTDSRTSVNQILKGIEEALAVGLTPVKVNVVLQRGVNDHQIIPIAGHFRGTGVIVRFIEYMDVGTCNGWRPTDVVSAQEILATLSARWPIEPVEPRFFGEVAQRWRYRDGGGEIGVIASVTQPFCRTCTRLRLSTDGTLFTCLFAEHGYDLKTPLRAGIDDETLQRSIAALWQRRSDRYSEARALLSPIRPKRVEMSFIGG